MMRTYTIKVEHITQEDLEPVLRAIAKAGWTPITELDPMDFWLE